MSSFLHNIYTFFSYLHTLLFGSLFTRTLTRQATLTPFPMDLECGQQDSNNTGMDGGGYRQSGASERVHDPPTSTTPVSPQNHAISLNAFRYNPGANMQSPPSTPCRSNPSHMYTQRNFPQLVSQTHRPAVSISSIPSNPGKTQSLSSDPSHLATHCRGPSTSSSCYSRSSMYSTGPASHYNPVLATPSSSASPYPPTSPSSSLSPCSKAHVRNRHRKQSPLIWYKDMSTIAMSASMSSIGSGTSSLGPGRSGLNSQYHYPGPGLRYGSRPMRYRTTPISPLSYIKHDPNMSLKRSTARMSAAMRRQSRTGNGAATSSRMSCPSREEVTQDEDDQLQKENEEDPVTVVRRAFGDLDLTANAKDKHATVNIRARINRETARSFGGMEVVDEEEEGDQDEAMASSVKSASASICSTPSSLGPLTPRAPHYARHALMVAGGETEAEADDEFSSGVESDAALDSEPSMYSIATTIRHVHTQSSQTIGSGLLPSTTCATIRSTCLPYLQDRTPAPSTQNGLCMRAFDSAYSDRSLSGSGSVVSPVSAKSFRTLKGATMKGLGGVGAGANGNTDVASRRRQQSLSQRDVERTVSVMSYAWTDAVAFSSYSVHVLGKEEEEEGSDSGVGSGSASTIYANESSSTTSAPPARTPSVLLGLDVEEDDSVSSRLALFKFGYRPSAPVVKESDSLDVVAVNLDLEREVGSDWETGAVLRGPGGFGRIAYARDSLVLAGGHAKSSQSKSRSGFGFGGVGSLANIPPPSQTASIGHVVNGFGYSDGYVTGAGYATKDSISHISQLRNKGIARDTLVMRDSAHWSDIIQLR